MIVFRTCGIELKVSVVVVSAEEHFDFHVAEVAPDGIKEGVDEPSKLNLKRSS